MNTIKAFSQDQKKIKELLTHCLYNIYRQQDLTKYFSEMVAISKLMRAYYLYSQENQILGKFTLFFHIIVFLRFQSSIKRIFISLIIATIFGVTKIFERYDNLDNRRNNEEYMRLNIIKNEKSRSNCKRTFVQKSFSR